MKRYILPILVLALCLALCVSCKGNDEPKETPAPESTPSAESTPLPESQPETEPCDHDFSSGWKQNELYHWKECSECGHSTEIDYHTYELAFVEKAPTESEEGSGFYVCEVCGIMEKQVIPAGTVLETE